MNTPSPVRTAFNRAHNYDQQARIQARIAQQLAHGFDLYRQSLPVNPPSHLPLFGLELGCGTGFLSRLWLERLPQTHLFLTDIAPAMVTRTRENLRAFPEARKSFIVMDAEAPSFRTPFDLIAASMVFQWFRHPATSITNLLDLLAPGGRLLFATLGPDTFKEWRTLCATTELPCGLHRYPEKNFWLDLAAQHHIELELTEEHIEESFPSPMAFLQRLKAIGADTPIANHTPAPAGKLRRILANPKGSPSLFPVTHHLYFGTFIKRPQPIHNT
ncbi:MAG: methyltransferase [Magnetococcales bacterium]|nr:methyltransferase [Magnetococcales bacterium]MBF0151656.1 methyltransferase [Magnetococcales bacterium]MBF0174463.1 methyltransferase [Magnetococcales bacterium]MBF0631506.1 methyltransferase [Magnetococcales bacterium]